MIIFIECQRGERVKIIKKRTNHKTYTGESSGGAFCGLAKKGTRYTAIHVLVIPQSRNGDVQTPLVERCLSGL